MSAMQEHGFRAVLNELSPALSFSDGRLDINDGENNEITLSGTGLVLMPSIFRKGPPLLMHKDLSDDVWYLVYPARRPTASPDGLEKGLESLFGATRAAAMRAVQQSRTTSELAELLGTSVATASRHAATLRVGGLVDSRREGKAVRHRLTQLGWAVVASVLVKKAFSLR
jgi:DNA-binding transcriptional ArsR family regulator